MGPLLLVLALPPVVYWLWTSVALHGGVPARLPRIPAPSLQASLLYMVWWIVQVGLARALPGREVEGTVLADGTRLRYRLNGWRAFWVSLALVLLASAAGVIPPGFAHEHFGELLSAANVFTFAFAAWLWWRFGRRRFFSGAALNPRVGGFDLKFFCETRPGLILWAVIVLSLAAAQWQRHGAVSPEMALVVAFQLLYVGDCLFHEEAL